jgi:porphobilinogen synthase
MFPLQRPRRLRKNAFIRNLVRETSIDLSHLIYPMFISASVDRPVQVPSMPGVHQHTIDSAVQEASDLFAKGVHSFLFFGIPEKKDAHATGAYRENGIIQKTLRAIRKQLPDAVLFTDVCLCSYTDTGHCGVVRDGKIVNDESVELLSRSALSHADAGADFVAPSDMMDGRVLAIRKKLDENGFEDIGILSYAAKFASSFYGPFRDAAHSAPQFGDRRTHQMDPANRLEALKEMQLDLDEGADMLMVKPALPYLDILRDARERFVVPLVAYNVSGEYSMVKAAGQQGWINEQQVRDEMLLAIRRAGADIIITYFAKELANKTP